MNEQIHSHSEWNLPTFAPSTISWLVQVLFTCLFQTTRFCIKPCMYQTSCQTLRRSLLFPISSFLTIIMTSDSAKSSFNLEPILHSKYYGSIPMGKLCFVGKNVSSMSLSVTVHVAEIDSSKSISQTVKDLNKIVYDERLKHLKRVFKSDVLDKTRLIIGRVEDISPQQLDRCRDLGLDGFDVVDVPATQPWTRLQFEECKRIWPVNFHEEKR